MTVYKGFKKDLTCLGYQFVPGLNVTDEANCRHNGFHAAEDPLDCLSYYGNMKDSIYWLCSADGDIDEDGEDSKVSCTRLTLYKQLSVEEFVFHALWYMIQHPNRERNKIIQQDKGFTDEYTPFVIVRGRSPIAKGRLHDVLGLYVEGTPGEIGLFTIDGEQYKPDTWYDARGKEVAFDE